MASKTEKREYTKTEVYLGNSVIVIWGLFGAAVCALFNIFAAVGFLALAGFLIYYEIGKKGCVSCFYCKVCTVGMGKLFDVFFTKRGNENINRKAQRLIPFAYLMLSVIPIALILIAIAEQLTILKVALLVGLLVFSTVSGVAVVRRRALKTKHEK